MDHLKPLNEHVIKSMKGNKGKDTGPEITLRRALRANGIRGYRLQWKCPGRPDLAFPSRKVAIFVNGCFWHRCPLCNLPAPKNNSEYWRHKFEANVARDRRVQKELENNGWTVIVVWECEIKRKLPEAVDRISLALTGERVRAYRSDQND